MNKKKFKRVILIFLALYVALFIARAVFVLVTFEDADDYYSGYSENYLMYTSSASSSILNIAGERKEIKTSVGIEILDQKYEKIASIAAKTIDYDEDEKKLKSTIEDCSAVVQMENKSGLTGSRRLNLTIGVKPDYFETAVERINKIGKVTSFTTTKTDKTYEYRQMVAEKERLAEQIESCREMKNRGGSITELLLLEDRIIATEALLKDQSVLLGDYSDDNALCTIKFTMYEGNVTSLWSKLWSALTWSTKLYLSIIGVLILTCLAAVVVILVINLGKKLYDKFIKKAPVESA